MTGPNVRFTCTHAVPPLIAEVIVAVVRAVFRVVAPPQTFFIDGSGTIQSIQIGELTEADFERQYARIAP